MDRKMGLQSRLLILALIFILPLSFAQSSGCGTAGAQTCLDAHTLQVCGADGNWTSQACAADEHCTGGACVPDCGAAGATRCADERTGRRPCG